MTDDETRRNMLVGRVDAAATELAAAKADVESWTETLHEAIRAAIAAGAPSGVVARVAGVSRGRVSQIAPREKGTETRSQAGKNAPEPVRVMSPDTVPTMPDASVGTLSGRASTRERKPYGRRTLFYDVRDGTSIRDDRTYVTMAGDLVDVGSVSAILAATMFTPGVRRVFLVGPAPFDLSTGATHAEAVRAWALAPLAPTLVEDGWAIAPAGHYLHDPDLPTLRFVNPVGDVVSISRAASWWGETDAHVAVCASAWIGLGTVLDAIPAFAGAGLADTPATTGRALWARTIPEGKSYPVLSDEFRELIASTAGQGRKELLPPPAPGALVPRFTYMDGRFMYASLTWGMPVGEPDRWTRGRLDTLSMDEEAKTFRGRGRWLVDVEVPSDWDHVGLLMAPAGSGVDRDWVYPSEPGQTFRTWADGSEVWLAKTHGWNVTVREGFTMAEGKPLDSWRDALVKAWEQTQGSPSPAAKLAGKAIRSILLHAIGAFASRAHNVTGACSAEHPDRVPADVVPGSVRRVGDHLVWERPSAVPEWSADKAHPEWSATVWARARTRLLAGPSGVGALGLPRSTVVAFSTDALYLAREAVSGAVSGAGWDELDDGKPGRFRSKGSLSEPVPWPADWSELYRLRDAAEEGGE